MNNDKAPNWQQTGDAEYTAICGAHIMVTWYEVATLNWNWMAILNNGTNEPASDVYEAEDSEAAMDAAQAWVSSG